MAQPNPVKCEVCGAGGVASELHHVKLCSACTNIAAKSEKMIDEAVAVTVIDAVQRLSPRPVNMSEDKKS